MDTKDTFIEDAWDDDDEEKEVKTPVPTEEIITMNVDKGQESIRIDKYIQSRITNITRTKIQHLIDEGKLSVNGNEVKSNYKIRPLDEIILRRTRSEEFPTEILPEDIPLNIVYEDDVLMVINKPANMVVHPANGNYSGTLINAVAFHLQAQNPTLKDVPERIGLVHRIDKDTTGLILIAKTDDALVHLQKQFKAHTVHRRYHALVWGDFEITEGTIEGNIGRNERFRKIMEVYKDEDKGKHAVTHYKVLEHFLYVSLLEFRLETGRTHQIRVHAKHIGHPLFNDATYGGARIAKGTVFPKYTQFVENCFKILPRQALHAKELGFIHPVTNEEMLFDSALPEDLTTVIERWRTYIKSKV